MHSRDWLEQQLPGLEDAVLWEDLAMVVSIPKDVRPGLTNKVNVRFLYHDNFLEWGRRTCTRDTITGLDLSALPAAMDDALDEFAREVWSRLNPFI